MKFTPIILIHILILFVLTTPTYAEEVEDYSSTINTFKQSAEVKKFFDNAYGYAVFPIIGKGGYVIGGSFGKGQVYRNGEVTGKTSVIEGSIGFQFGGKAFSEIIFFQDKKAYTKFTNGNVEFDASVQATVITAGAQAEVGTTGSSAGASTGPNTAVQAKAKYINGMATFIHSKGGFMVEASIGGQKFTFEPI